VGNFPKHRAACAAIRSTPDGVQFSFRARCAGREEECAPSGRTTIFLPACRMLSLRPQSVSLRQLVNRNTGRGNGGQQKNTGHAGRFRERRSPRVRCDHDRHQGRQNSTRVSGEPWSRQIRASIGLQLEMATRARENFIIRPRSTTATLNQLDDLPAEAAAAIGRFAFMVLCTSPGNFQAWVAVKDAPADFARRLRKGSGADPSASGATRISGSLNFKTKYAPMFPMVEITQA
jgi:hypothetical protein